MPVYNAEKYIQNTLEYIHNQTMTDIEIICIDDGSTDCSAEIISRFMKTDNRIKMYHQPNMGAGVARNHGLKYATGEYVSFLDADDIFDANMLKKTYDCAKKTDADIVIFRSNLLDMRNGKIKDANWALRKNQINNMQEFSPKIISKYIFQFCNGWPWDKLFKHSFIIEHKLQFQNTHFFNDSLFVYSALMFSSKIAIFDEILATKRINSGENQISLNRSKYWIDFTDVINSIHTVIENNNFSEYQQSFNNYAIHIALVMLDTTTIETNKHLIMYYKDTYAREIDFESTKITDYYNQEEYERFKNITKNKEAENKQNNSKNLINISYFGIDKIHSEDECLDYVPIILAADENYFRQMYITIYSLLLNRNISTKYIIYALIPKKFSDSTINYFRTLISNYENCQLRIIVMGDIFSDIKTTISHITSPTYYRLVAADIVPFDKCIYLDVDLVVQKDLMELYNIDLGDNYIAGVKAPVYHCQPNGNREHCILTGLKSIDQYINAGVLVLNLKKLRNQEIRESMIKLAHKQLPSQDQDVFNIISYGHITFLDIKYNVMTKYSLTDYKKFNQLVSVFGIKNTVDAYTDPSIIHYADKHKPWKDIGCLYSDIWWKYCSDTPFFKTIWNEMLLNRQELYQKSDTFISIPEEIKSDFLKKTFSGEIARMLAGTETSTIDKKLAISYYSFAINKNYELLNEFAQFLLTEFEEPERTNLMNSIIEKQPNMAIKLSQYYRDGKYTEKNLKKAAELMKKVTPLRGHNLNEYLSILWELHTSESLNELENLCKKEEECCNAIAIRYLARIYFENENYSDSKKMYRKALSINPKITIFEYTGILYNLGSHDDLNECFQIASNFAKIGNKDAQYRLGKMYYDGNGVEKDISKAEKYLQDAANNGSNLAIKDLEIIKKKKGKVIKFILETKKRWVRP